MTTLVPRPIPTNVPRVVRDEVERDTEIRAAENRKSQSPSLVLLVLFATLGIITYAAFLLNPASRGDWLPYSMVIAAESLLIAQALLSMWTILSGSQDPRDFAFHQAKSKLFRPRDVLRDGLTDAPERWAMHLDDDEIEIDVFITTYGESIDIIRRTVTAAVAMQGAHHTWVLDDGKSDRVRNSPQKSGHAMCGD